MVNINDDDGDEHKSTLVECLVSDDHDGSPVISGKLMGKKKEKNCKRARSF